MFVQNHLSDGEPMPNSNDICNINSMRLSIRQQPYTLRYAGKSEPSGLS